jgi:hypothetical protein
LLVAALALPEATAQKGPSCPLTDAQTRKSIDAFGKFAAFVTHEPRCVNCHGGVNPYMDGTGLDPENPAAAPSIIEHAPGKQFHEKKGEIDIECTNQCHSAMAPTTGGSKSRWFLAADFHSFVDKDATTLCKQIKQSTGSAKDFIGHLTDDNGKDNFVGTAFNGDRGLSADIRKEWKVVVQKPSFNGKELTKAEFIKLGQDWIDAMGGSFKGDPGCGCELKHSKWSGRIQYVLDSRGDEGESSLQSWGGREFVKITIILNDGVGTAEGHAVKSGFAENRQAVAGGGYKKDTSQRSEGKADGSSPATVDVRINETTKTYDVVLAYAPIPAGKESTEICIRESCNTKESAYPVTINMVLAMSDKLTDPNHVSGSQRDIRTNTGRSRKGVYIRSLTWDLSRTGSSN